MVSTRCVCIRRCICTILPYKILNLRPNIALYRFGTDTPHVPIQKDISTQVYGEQRSEDAHISRLNQNLYRKKLRSHFGNSKLNKRAAKSSAPSKQPRRAKIITHMESVNATGKALMALDICTLENASDIKSCHKRMTKEDWPMISELKLHFRY